MRASSRKLSPWYQQLAQRLDAGIPLVTALADNEPDPAIARVRRSLEQGGPADRAWRESASWIPMADVEVLAAGSQSGRTPALLRALAERHAVAAEAKTRLLLACLYPVILVHLAALVLPLRGMIDWETGFTWRSIAYLRGLAVVLLPFWTVVAALFLWSRSAGGGLFALATRLPVFGRYLRTREVADVTLILAHLLAAGAPLLTAWRAAGQAVRWPALRAAIGSIGQTIERGQPPGPTLSALGVFPADFVTVYRTGERTGSLDDGLLRLHASLRAQAGRALWLAVALVTAALFLTAAGLVALTVVQFYLDYLRGLEQVFDS